jgi:hypothetical protein
MKKMKTYNVEFIHPEKGYSFEHIKAFRIEDACAYIRGKGYEIVKVYELK